MASEHGESKTLQDLLGDIRLPAPDSEIVQRSAPPPSEAALVEQPNPFWSLPSNLESVIVKGYGKVDPRLLIAACSRLWNVEVSQRRLYTNLNRTGPGMYVALSFHIEDFPIISTSKHVSLAYGAEFVTNTDFYRRP
jgi:hypothetical protein